MNLSLDMFLFFDPASHTTSFTLFFFPERRLQNDVVTSQHSVKRPMKTGDVGLGHGNTHLSLSPKPTSKLQCTSHSVCQMETLMVMHDKSHTLLEDSETTGK